MRHTDEQIRQAQYGVRNVVLGLNLEEDALVLADTVEDYREDYLSYLHAYTDANERAERAENALRAVEDRLPVDDDPYDGAANGVIRGIIRAALQDTEERDR